MAQQRFGAVEVAVEPQHRREIAQAHGGFAGPVSEQRASDRQRLAVERLGARVQALILVDAAELGQRVGDVRMLDTVDTPPDGQGRFEVCGRRLIVALLRGQCAEIVQRLRDAGVLGPERRAAAGERLFEQLLRLVVQTDAPVHPPDDGEDLRLRIRLIGQFRLDSIGGGVEEAGDREAIRAGAIRDGVRAAQQTAERLADPRRFCRLALRAVALGGEPVRIEGGHAGEDDHTRRRCRDAALVPLDESDGASPRPLGTCADRLVLQIAPEIIRQTPRPRRSARSRSCGGLSRRSCRDHREASGASD